MGHQIQHQISMGTYQLTQCSCGRGALRIRNKIILLSSLDLREIGELFSEFGRNSHPSPESLAGKLNKISDDSGWKDFSLPQ